VGFWFGTSQIGDETALNLFSGWQSHDRQPCLRVFAARGVLHFKILA
jgi:hypothetical protein